MPGPDPDGLGLEEFDGGRFNLTAYCFSNGNRRHRLARMLAVRKRLRWGGWKCLGCGEPVPLYRRADADYCSEGCRKTEARARRQRRAEIEARWSI